MAEPGESRPSSEIAPAETLYNGCCDFLLGDSKNEATYWEDAHYRRIALAGEEEGIVALVHDYYASSTRHWGHDPSEGFSADPAMQRELLQRRQTLVALEFTDSKYLIFRPSDLREQALLAQSILYGYWDVEPDIPPGTYDPDEILVVSRPIDGDTFTQVKNPATDPLLSSLTRQFNK